MITDVRRLVKRYHFGMSTIQMVKQKLTQFIVAFGRMLRLSVIWRIPANRYVIHRVVQRYCGYILHQKQICFHRT